MNKTIKLLILLIIGSVFSVYAITGNPPVPAKHPEKYCAKMKDGKKVVMHMGSAITADVTLNNGTVVKTDGTIVKSDGSTMTLKEGECISKDGDMSMEKHKKDKKSK